MNEDNLSRPARSALRFLSWFCPPSLYEGIEGDLLERFEEDLRAWADRSPALAHRRASRRFVWNLIRFFRPGILLRNKFAIHFIRYDMIRNYFIVALRNAMRNKLFSFVNVAGLSLGLAISFLVLIHVRQELSYEKHLPHYELIYRVASKYWAKVSPPLASALKQDLPEAHRVGRLYYLSPAIVEFGDAQTFSNYTYHADTSILDVFEFELVVGNPKTVLSDPSAIVLTEALAGKLFKEGVDPIGKEVVLDGYLHYTVSGIMKDQPATTHLKIDCLLSMAKSNAYSSDSRTWSAVSTYVRFDSPEDAAKVADKLRQFQYRYREGIQTKEEVDRAGDYFELHPITEIHLNSHREKETEANSDMIYIYIFSAFGILIIFIASINFINLFTAQAIKRIKEIGIRKAIGAQRPQLITQFLGESFLTVCVSGILALGLAYLVFPWYNQIAAAKLNPHELFSMNNLSAMLTLVFATGVLAGGYPAYVISRSKAVDSFKNSSTPFGKKSLVRGMLVGAQFAVSLFLLMATLLVYSQMVLIHNKSLGYNKEEVIGIKLYGKLWLHATQHNEALRNELLKSPDVKEITLTDRLMGERFGWESFTLTDRPDEETINARYLRVSDGFLETMEIELIEGSGFERSTDSIPMVILNETAAKLLHTNDLIGKEYVNRAQNGDPGRIVGIVKDFNFASLHAVIDPLVIEKRVEYPDNLVIRIDGSHSREALAHIESVLKTAVPGTSVFYSFIDEKLRALYGKEEGLYYTVQIFSFVTMIIACLGLFALAANTAEARTKEIGIRKVMGASVRSILVLLCSDYMKLIFFAMAVAVPVVIYFGSEWLMGFAYKVEMSWWMFALPALVVIILAMTAIAGQSVRVAKANPAKSLKHE